MIRIKTDVWHHENMGYRHGLGPGQYWKMWEDQDGRCAICPREFDRSGLKGTDKACIDHDHAHCPGDNGCPKCVRSLLCNGCNVMLGRAFDDPAILRRLKPTKRYSQDRIDAGIAYLEFWHDEMAKRGVRPSPEEALWQDFYTAAIHLISAIS